MVAFKRALALGLALTAFSQVSYASSPLDDVKEPVAKARSIQVVSSTLDEPKVKKTFGLKVKSFFSSLFSCIKETSAVIETAAPVVQAGLTVAADITGNQDVKEAAAITGAVGHITHDIASAQDVNLKLVGTVAGDVKGILDAANVHDQTADKILGGTVQFTDALLTIK